VRGDSSARKEMTNPDAENMFEGKGKRLVTSMLGIGGLETGPL